MKNLTCQILFFYELDIDDPSKELVYAFQFLNNKPADN
jgi:hypothetical protein